MRRRGGGWGERFSCKRRKSGNEEKGSAMLHGKDRALLGNVRGSLGSVFPTPPISLYFHLFSSSTSLFAGIVT
jgi:hypothetical protein